MAKAPNISFDGVAWCPQARADVEFRTHVACKRRTDHVRMQCGDAMVGTKPLVRQLTCEVLFALSAPVWVPRRSNRRPRWRIARALRAWSVPSECSKHPGGSIRPVHAYSEDHVRVHVSLCVLASHVQWHVCRRLAPLLFEDDDREGARVRRRSPVELASDRNGRSIGMSPARGATSLSFVNSAAPSLK